MECPSCHTPCTVPVEAVVIDARKAKRIRRRSDKAPRRLATDVPGAHTLLPEEGRTRLKPTPPSVTAPTTPAAAAPSPAPPGAPDGAGFRVVPRNDLLPRCPHCSVELPEVYTRTEGTGPAQGRDAVYFCPHCRRVLGVGSGGMT